MRLLCHFSCGTASAVATKLTLAENDPAKVVIVNAFVQEEADDNRRFLADCERWFGHPVTVLRDHKYNASTDEVWLRKAYMKGPNGAPCSMLLKRVLLREFAHPDDVNVIGYTSEEEDRLAEYIRNNPDVVVDAPLIRHGLTKSACRAMVDRAGIELPLMSRKGYDNDNCIGCPKGGQNYWQRIRYDFPDRFAQLVQIQEHIGPGAYFLRFRSGPRKNERMSLAELPEGIGNLADEPSFSCGFHCEVAETVYTG